MLELEAIQKIEEEHEAWWSMRQALSDEDKEAFDRLWASAKEFTNAAATVNRALVYETVSMGMLVGLARQMLSLRKGEAASVPQAESNQGNPIGHY